MTGDESRRRLERALDQGGRTHGVSDVVQMIREGKAQFWRNGDGMVVTEVDEYPLLKSVNYWLCWGALKPCLDLQDEIDAWAIGEGCTVATATGRPGWGRALVPYGWKVWQPRYIKHLGAQEDVP